MRKGSRLRASGFRRLSLAGDLVTTPDSIPAIVNYADGGNWTELGESLEAIGRMDFDLLVGGRGPNLTKKTRDEIGQTLIKEFNWGSGPAAGNLAGMMQELR